MRDSRPDACVIGLAHASSVFLRRAGPRSDLIIILYKNKKYIIYIYTTKSLDVYCGVLGPRNISGEFTFGRGRTLFVLVLLLSLLVA